MAARSQSWSRAGRMRHPYFPIIAVLLLMATAVQAAENRLDPVADPAVAPELDLLDLTGKRHRMADYRGQLVLVTFWATWCPECIYEMPSLQRVWERLRGRGFVLLAVNVDEPPEVVARFATMNGLRFPLLLDPEMAAYKRWPVLGVPASYVVAADGLVRYEAVGARDWDAPEMRAVLERLLGGDR